MAVMAEGPVADRCSLTAAALVFFCVLYCNTQERAIPNSPTSLPSGTSLSTYHLVANTHNLSLRIPLARANIVHPPSGETKVTIVESVRDYDVYILNTVRLPSTLSRLLMLKRVPEQSTLR